MVIQSSAVVFTYRYAGTGIGLTKICTNLRGAQEPVTGMWDGGLSLDQAPTTDN